MADQRQATISVTTPSGVVQMDRLTEEVLVALTNRLTRIEAHLARVARAGERAATHHPELGLELAAWKAEPQA